MKTIIIIALFVVSLTGYSQVGITTPITTPPTPNTATELDVESLNGNTGVLIPSFVDADLTNGSSVLNAKQPTNGMLIYNSTKNRFMFNAGTGATPIWSFVGSIPVIPKHSDITTPIEGEIMYDVADGNIWYYAGTDGWHKFIP